MGLNTGFVVVGAIGDNLRMDYTAVGDTTHLAARLQQLAQPDTILVGETTARLVTGYVRLAPLDPVSIKGLSDAVTMYRVEGRRRSPLDGVDERALTPFVGRDRELATLKNVLEQSEAGEGQLVGIVGEPGVGKSRLLLEFRRSVADRPLTPRSQRTRPREDDSSAHYPRPLPALRHAPRLSRGALIMPTPSPRSPPQRAICARRSA
jgi:AAA ATPase domain/Adenylate and Guanylate cyclase catalytic domain